MQSPRANWSADCFINELRWEELTSLQCLNNDWRRVCSFSTRWSRCDPDRVFRVWSQVFHQIWISRRRNINVNLSTGIVVVDFIAVEIVCRSLWCFPCQLDTLRGCGSSNDIGWLSRYYNPKSSHVWIQVDIQQKISHFSRTQNFKIKKINSVLC